MITRRHFVLFILILFLINTLPAQAPGAIRPGSAHPQYWEYNGENVLLLGGSVEDNLFQVQDIEAQLDLLKACGGNYIRNTMSSRDEGNVWPFYYDENAGKYDLDKWNEEYWNRFSRTLALAAERDIIVQVEIWATFDFYRENWEVNPFNPKNNTNYSAGRTDLPLEVPTHPIYCDNSFFWSVPNHDNNMPVLWYQQRFVDKLLTYTFRHGNVLYCMDNETSVTAEWGRFWATYIQKKAAEAGREVYCTEMWDPHDLDHIAHRETFDHPELYAFVEISQNNHQRGQAHWDNGLRQIERLRRAGHLRPVDNVKIYGADGGRHGGGTQEGIAKFIRSIFFGAASARFHRPTSGIGLSAEAQAVIRSVRNLTDQMDFFNSTPHNDLLGDREADEAYCRAIPGKEFAVYFPNGGEVQLKVEGTKAPLTLRWLKVFKSEWSEPKEVEVQRDGTVALPCPGEGHWIAWVGGL